MGMVKVVGAGLASLTLCFSMLASAQNSKDSRNTCSAEYLGCNGMRDAYRQLDASLTQLSEASKDKSGDIEQLSTDINKAKDLVYAGLIYANCNMIPESQTASKVFIDIDELLTKGDLFRVCPHRAIALTLLGTAQNALVNADPIFDGLRVQALAIVDKDIPLLESDIASVPRCAAAAPAAD
jgi:hypothetical protein